MPLPLALPLPFALPASAAALAYLDARLGLSYDYALLSTYIRATLRYRLAERRDTVNLFYALETHATDPRRGSHPFLIFDGRQWTYKEAYETVLRYAGWLRRKLGVVRGEVVAMDFVNSDVFVWVWFALWSLGATPAFINYNLSGPPLLHSVRTSSARLLLVDGEVKGNFTEEVMAELGSAEFRTSRGGGRVEVVFFSPEVEREILAGEGFRAPNEDRGGQKLTDMALLVYTSGTTGLPKPAVVAWTKCTAAPGFLAGWLPVKKTDVYYTCMPLYHGTASFLAVCPVLLTGATLSLGRRFSRTTFWADVRASNATIIQYVGETCRYLLSAPPSPLDRAHRVRAAFGNGLRPDVWAKFKHRFGIPLVAEFYGATEGPTALWNRSFNSFAEGAIGRIGAVAGLIFGASATVAELDFATNTLVRDARTGLCKTGLYDKPGELLYRLDERDIGAKFQGYYNNAGASRAKVVRDVKKKGDAWFSSGDVVRRDREGRWYFCDRIGDTFRWKSENVSTAEVAEVLGHVEGVEEANVYGVVVPGHDGRAGCAAIVLREGVQEGEKGRVLEEVARQALANLPRYAVPVFVRVARTMQTTGTNKQQKHVLREEGADPEMVGKGGDELFWLHGETYRPFGRREWERLRGGEVKL